jgi:hypothetical protein
MSLSMYSWPEPFPYPELDPSLALANVGPDLLVPDNGESHLDGLKCHTSKTESGNT